MIITTIEPNLNRVKNIFFFSWSNRFNRAEYHYIASGATEAYQGLMNTYFVIFNKI